MNENAQTPEGAASTPIALAPSWLGGSATTHAEPRRSRLAQTLRPALVLPLIVIALALSCAGAPELIAPFDPTDLDSEAILQPPSLEHWMGTDHFGRDVLSLVIHGTRHSLLIGALAVIVGAGTGGALGLVAGYVGGAVDMIAMRFIDLWLSVPEILLAIIIATALGPSFGNTVLAVGLVSIPRYARVMRAQAISVSRRPFIEAARSIGSDHATILLRHILPHAISPLLVMATLGVASGILAGASLSFIGLGTIDDRPDWGFLLNQGRNYLTVAWWFATFPGLAITLLVISVNLLGDALRDRLDPHQRGR